MEQRRFIVGAHGVFGNATAGMSFFVLKSVGTIVVFR
jgi:hypothetical protein